MTSAYAQSEPIAMSTQAIDPRELRKALGTFMTGVTVITTVDADGHPRGFTANSFTSVSLEPPLVLACIDHKALSYPVYAETEHFAVNVLADEQREVSGTFAGKASDKFSHVNWHHGVTGSPLIDGSLAWVDCRVYKRVEAGDHLILIGEVKDFHYTPANPLGYFRGAYLSSGLERDAIPSPGQETFVGGILECDGKVLLIEDAQGNLSLPAGARLGPANDPKSLLGRLQTLQLDAAIGFLFAVFEHDDSGSLNVYYRGQIRRGPGDGAGVRLIALDEIPWERLPDSALRSMLGRYVNERLEDQFGVYVGDFEAGRVHSLESQK